MTEFARLLKDAAGAPPRPLDMVGIRQRAARLGWRARASLSLAVVIAALGIGGPVRTVVLSSRGGNRDVDTVGVHHERLRPQVLPGAASGPSTTAALASPLAARRPTRTAAAEPASDENAASSGDSPYAGPAASCAVDNSFLEAGESKRCRFTATAPGGWNYYRQGTSRPESDIVNASVHVTRNGETTTYRTKQTTTWPGTTVEGCADNIIQPGDVVEVVVTKTANYSWMDVAADTEGAGAGQHWGCTNPGP